MKEEDVDLETAVSTSTRTTLKNNPTISRNGGVTKIGNLMNTVEITHEITMAMIAEHTTIKCTDKMR